MPGPNNVKWGNGSHYCVITLTAPSIPPPTASCPASPIPTPTTQITPEWLEGVMIFSLIFKWNGKGMRTTILSFPSDYPTKCICLTHYSTTLSISDTLTFSPRDPSACSKKTLSTGNMNGQPDLLIQMVRLESLPTLQILNLNSSPFTQSRVFLSFKGERTPAIWTFVLWFLVFFFCLFFLCLI